MKKLILFAAFAFAVSFSVANAQTASKKAVKTETPAKECKKEAGKCCKDPKCCTKDAKACSKDCKKECKKEGAKCCKDAKKAPVKKQQILLFNLIKAEIFIISAFCILTKVKYNIISLPITN